VGVLLLMNMLMRKMTLFMNMQLRKTRSAFQIISGLSMHLCVCLCVFQNSNCRRGLFLSTIIYYRIHCPGALLGDKTINIVRHIEREGGRERERERMLPSGILLHVSVYIPAF
jgi:hypothetical protein